MNPYEHCCSLAPQTSASANSATSATERYYRRLEGRLSNRVLKWWIVAVEWLGTHDNHHWYCVLGLDSRHTPHVTLRTRTKEKSSRCCGRIWVAGVQGFEPQLSDSESDVLPLYYTPTSPSGADEEIRTLTRSPSLRPERSASASSATSAQPLVTSVTVHETRAVCQIQSIPLGATKGIDWVAVFSAG